MAFVVQEIRAQEPLLPLRLFRDRTFSVGNGIGIIAGMSMFGTIAFLPLYLQVVKGVSATTSGLHTSPLIVALVFTVILAGRAISRTGRYRMYPIIGTGMVTVGLFLLSRLTTDSSWLEISLFLAVVGVGMGLTMQVIVIAVQNSVSMRDMGTSTAAVNFFRSMGGALGVALFGAILSNRLDVYLLRYVPAGADTGITHGHLNASPAQLHALPEAVYAGVVHSFSLGVTDVFFWAAPVSVLAFALSWLIREIPLRQTVDQAPPEL
jgi:MFS family permease